MACLRDHAQAHQQSIEAGMQLFRPLTIGSVRLPNRIALTALPSGHAAVDGFVHPALITYYAERARGGAGLVVIEAAYPLPPQAHTAHVAIHADVHIAGLRDCIRAVRRYGAVTLVMIDQPLPVASLRVDQLRALVDAWAAAAWRAHAAGADGVMVSCADGGPFDQLLSPLTNRRADGYGGDSSRRMRLLIEAIDRMRSWMGSRLLIGARLKAEEFLPGGITLQDARVIAKRLIGAGVALLEVSAEAGEAVPIARFPGWRVPLAAGIKAVVEVPVMVGGLLADPELANSVIRDGSADIVALGESLRTEPRWPQYALATLAEHDP